MNLIFEPEFFKQNHKAAPWYRCTFNCLVVLRNKCHHISGQSEVLQVHSFKNKECKHFWRFFLYGLQSGFPIPEQVGSHHLCVCRDKGTNLMPSINIVLKSGLTLKQKLRSYYKDK